MSTRRARRARVACSAPVTLCLSLVPAVGGLPAQPVWPALAAVSAVAVPTIISGDSWDADASNLGAAGDIGKTFTFICPATDDSPGSFSVEGATTYYANSDVCAAAVHAGVLGGTKLGDIVTISLQQGQPNGLTGSSAHGITSDVCASCTDTTFTVQASDGGTAAGQPTLPLG